MRSPAERLRLTYDEEYELDEFVDESIKTGGDIALGWGIGKAGSYAFGRLIGPLARKITPIIGQRARELGRAAELFVANRYNLLRNSKTLSELGGTGNFVPDLLSKTALREIKNVGRLAWDRQLQAFATFAKQTGRKYVIHVRPGTKVSAELTSKLEGVFGRNSRGTAWDILADVPEDMKVVNALLK